MFKWKEAYSCNINEVDMQHKKLFEIANRVYELATYESHYDNYDEIMTLLDELKEYTSYHFNCEEELMLKNSYPNYQEHRNEHILFVAKINNVLKKDIDSSQNQIIIDLVSFVVDWISNHILKTDLKYKDFLNDAGVF